MLSKLLRIPRQPEAAMERTYLKLRIGLHAAFNASEEMYERVALERQLAGAEREALLQRAKGVITLGREIIHTWDNTGINSLTPERVNQLAGALEFYAAGLPQHTSLSPTLVMSELNQQEQRVMQLIASLPDWTSPTLTPATQHVQGATPS